METCANCGALFERGSGWPKWPENLECCCSRRCWHELLGVGEDVELVYVQFPGSRTGEVPQP